MAGRPNGMDPLFTVVVELSHDTSPFLSRDKGN